MRHCGCLFNVYGSSRAVRERCMLFMSKYINMYFFVALVDISLNNSFTTNLQVRTDRIVFKLFGKDPNDFPLVLRTQVYTKT